MIRIGGSTVDANILLSQYPSHSVESKILTILDSSDRVYAYRSLHQLQFEVKLRKSIIAAAIHLNNSNLSFRTFRKSKCNTRFWKRTEEGGFLLRSDVKPSDGINDIYRNSSRYGTECATAMVIVFYKAVLDVYGESLFDQVFNGIYLMDWQDVDPKLGVNNYRNPGDFLPGDCRYIKNPDVDPATPEWQGENAIDLGNGRYYGHGIGIKTEDEIIVILNSFRREGAQVSAYMMRSATRPDFKALADRMPAAETQNYTGAYSPPWIQ